MIKTLALVIAGMTQSPTMAELERQAYVPESKYLAASPVEDPTALGGFGEGGDLPSPLNGRRRVGILGPLLRFDRDGPLLVEVINTTDAAAWLPALDSKLQMILEVLDREGRWQPAERLRAIWCGNSRHRVQLPRNHAWTYRLSTNKGPFKTKLRAKLKTERGEVYSPPIEAAVPEHLYVLGSPPKLQR